MADQVFAVNSGFYDAVNSDRTYSADDMNRPYKRVVSNGVFATPQGTKSTDLQVVSAGNGMEIIVKKGDGIFADKWFENPAAINITVPNNTSTVPRIDSVLVQIDKRTSGRLGSIVYRTGTPSSNPSAPSINTVANVTEYRLANVRVNAGTTGITNSMITDRRGSSDCPWVTSLIYQVDTSTLYDQWAAAYEEYFEAEKAMWDDWYSHLTQELDVSMTLIKLTSSTVTESQTTEVPIGIPEYNSNTDLLEVYINGMRAIEGSQYTVNENTNIVLADALDPGQTVNFIVLKSIIMGNPDDIMSVIRALEERIGSIQGGTPSVVSSISEMTDTDKIYILSTDSKWYYYNLTSSAWVVGGTYGGVPTDATLTQSGMAADAETVGENIERIDSDIQTQIKVNGYDIRADFSIFPNKNDVVSYTGFRLIERRKNYYLFDGDTHPAQNLLRFAVFNDGGDTRKVISVAPTYEGYSRWYAPINDFIIGHTYYFGVRLISGSYTWTGTSSQDNFFDVRTQADGVLYQDKNSTWICDKIPEMVCFQIGKGSYQNAVFELSIIDVTEFENTDLTEKKLTNVDNFMSSINTMLDMPVRHAIKDSTSTKLSLLFFTDIHADAIAIGKISEYMSSHGGYIDEVINGGDTARYEFSSGANSNYFDSDLAPASLAVIGNHDSCVYGQNNAIDWWGKTSKQVYNRYISPYIAGWDVVQPDNAESLGLNYYYKDYNATSDYPIRIVYLDAMYWDTDQVNWFEDVLDDAKTNSLSVIVVAHGPDGSFTGDLDCDWTWIDKPNETGYYANMRFDGRAASTVNTFISRGGSFVCWVTGHSHLDRIGHMTAYPNQFVLNMINSGTKTADSRGALYAATMIVVDIANKLLKLVRTGCNYDAYLKPKFTVCYNYETQELISQT